VTFSGSIAPGLVAPAITLSAGHSPAEAEPVKLAMMAPTATAAAKSLRGEMWVLRVMSGVFLSCAPGLMPQRHDQTFSNATLKLKCRVGFVFMHATHEGCDAYQRNAIRPTSAPMAAQAVIASGYHVATNAAESTGQVSA
jgi:hypothetical protein